DRHVEPVDLCADRLELGVVDREGPVAVEEDWVGFEGLRDRPIAAPVVIGVVLSFDPIGIDRIDDDLIAVLDRDPRLLGRIELRRRPDRRTGYHYGADDDGHDPSQPQPHRERSCPARTLCASTSASSRGWKLPNPEAA